MLAQIRMREARALLNAGFPDGAYYLAGYSVECALKACIAKGTRKHDFPDKKRVDSSHTHSLRELVKLANLEDMRLQEANQYPAFRNNWDVVEAWSEQSRYRRHDEQSAQILVDAVDKRNQGVIAWVKRYW